MSDYDQILPVTGVKRDLLPLIKKVERLGESIAITKNGRPTAVLLSIDDYEGLLETIEILSSPRLLKLLRRSRKELDEGKFVSHRVVWQK